MFRGISFHTIDEKGRIIVPARFRDALRADGEDGVMLTRMDGCLYGYCMSEWRAIEQKVLSLAEQSETMRRFRRVFVGGAFDCAPDRQSRILVPPVLRGYAGLEREIAMVGVLNHFEIWSQKMWDMENERMAADLETPETRDEIARLGL